MNDEKKQKKEGKAKLKKEREEVKVVGDPTAGTYQTSTSLGQMVNAGYDD